MARPTCRTCGAPAAADASEEELCPGCVLRQALNEEDDPAPSSEEVPAGLEAGTRLGPFRIGRLIGKGGMAAVYEAHEAPPLSRTVALTVLPPEFLHDDTFARRFAREARVIASLEHPGIVPVYASGIDDGIPWISMRLLTGGSLGTVLQQGPPGVERSTRILEHLADAIDYAHARGVMHRDIKPSNILLDDAGRAYICDFGLARLVMSVDRWTRTGGLLGTPHYMAPEQAVSGSVDERCDIYSLGVVAYEMLTGAPPFDGDTPLAVVMQHAIAPVPAGLRDRCPSAMALAIERALAKNPADRWPSAKALVSAFDADGVHHTWRGRWIRTTSAAAVTVAIAAAGAFWFARDTLEDERTAVVGAQERGDIRLPPLDDGTTPPGAGERNPSPAKGGPPVPDQAVPGGGSALDPPLTVVAVTENPETDVDQLPAPELTTNLTPGEQGGPKPAPETATDVTVTVPPKPRIKVRPFYPSALKQLGVQGTVRVEVEVGPDGNVINARVLGKGPHPVLNDEALKAARQFTYEPGTIDGIAGTFKVEEAVTFALTDP